MSNTKPTVSELKALRRQIDRLNASRTELYCLGHMTDDQSVRLQEVIDNLEDRYIALVNESNA